LHAAASFACCFWHASAQVPSVVPAQPLMQPSNFVWTAASHFGRLPAQVDAQAGLPAPKHFATSAL
jgi:hypothetical protein